MRNTAGAVVDLGSDTATRPVGFYFEGNDFTNGDRNGSCVFSNGLAHVWKNNTFHDCGVIGVGGDDHGIYSVSDNEVLEGNVFRNLDGGYGIHYYTPGETITGTVIRQNLVYANPYDGGIYLGNGNGAEIYENVIYENTGSGVPGIVIAGSRSADKIWHNTITGNGIGLQINAGASSTEYRNNIICNNTSNVADSGTGTVSSGNLVAAACPSFTNSAADDYSLASGSAAIDAAATVTGGPACNGTGGTPCDQGAFETFLFSSGSV